MNDDYTAEITLYMTMLDTCPCCGHMSVDDEYDICHICGWEDDYVQRRHPDVAGANRTHLRQAQRNFESFGAVEERLLGSGITRSPESDEHRNPLWRPVDAAT